MRDVGEKVKYSKLVVVEEVGVKEDIMYINHSIPENYISVGTRLFNSSNEIIREENIIISGEKYDLLLSESSEFEGGKQEGSYREKDVWHIVDKIRDEEKKKTNQSDL